MQSAPTPPVPNSPNKGSLGDFSTSSLPTCPALLLKAPKTEGTPRSYRHAQTRSDPTFWSVAASQLLSITQQLDTIRDDTDSLKLSRSEMIDGSVYTLYSICTLTQPHPLTLSHSDHTSSQRI